MANQRPCGCRLSMYHIRLKAKLLEDYEKRRGRDQITRNEVTCVEAPLTVQLVDLYPRDNAVAHHTDRFLIIADPRGTPVLRRGLPAYLAVRFCRPLDTSLDMVRFVFELGPKPDVTSGTRHVISASSRPEPAVDQNRKSTWDIRVHRQDACITIFQVRIPVKCPVGIWRCKIQTSKMKMTHPNTKEYVVDDDIYILFNPWCPDDGVYTTTAEASRYVTSDCGMIWQGTYRQPRARCWVFGQYDDVVLAATMILLEDSGLEHFKRGSPVEVARAICNVVGTKSETAISSSVCGHPNPSAFTGSVAILEKYLNGEENINIFGNTSVASAVIVTVLRALGVPSRPVTAYVSAHGLLSVASYFTSEGEWLEPPPGGQSPPWSCHVWVEAWMSRPDLPPGYSGWQVLDPYYNHDASGISECGPTSVEAVRRGDIGLQYNTAFAYATVNGDLLHYTHNDQGFLEQRPTRYRVGCRIITDALMTDKDQKDDSFEDLTKNYKNNEGTSQERSAIVNAILGFPPPPKVFEMAKREIHEDLIFELVEIDNIMFGLPFASTVRVLNKGPRTHSICVTVAVSSVLLTGEKVQDICRNKSSFMLHPNQRENLAVSVKPEDYVDKLMDHSLIKTFAFASVDDSGQKWSEEDDFQMIKPKLTIEVKGVPTVSHECTVIFSFQNPLDVVLTHCFFCMEGPGLSRPKIQKKRNIMPNELVTVAELLTPTMSGKHKINASFTSRQLTEVVGSSWLQVAE